MNKFKKDIYKIKNESLIEPPNVYSFYVKLGSQTCVGGYVGIGSFTYQTVYSDTPTISIGSFIYSDYGMTLLVSNNFMQLTTSGDPFIDILVGEVQDVIAVGSPC